MANKPKTNLTSALQMMQSKVSKYGSEIEALRKPYSNKTLGEFASKLFNQTYDPDDITEIVWDADFKGVESMYLITQYDSDYEEDNYDSIAVLAVKLTTDSFKNAQRAYQKGVVTYYLENQLEFNRAIVAFYTDDDPTWRLSYIKIDDEDKIKVEKGEALVLPLYRWSFLVGEGEPCRTLQDQASKLVKINSNTNVFGDTEKPPTITQIEQVFTTVNAVTDDFYKKFMEHYIAIRNACVSKITNSGRLELSNSQSSEIDTHIKGILGQTIALFFLQKSGYLGVHKGEEWGTGSQTFINDMITNYQGLNIYKDEFEPLLLALSGDLEHPKYKIPTLNGGLFVPHTHLSNEVPLEIPSNQFIKFIKDLGTFNFTVSESDQYDKDIAVDPEMLGKIYESFIATEEVDGSNKRKDTGAFYTPPTIVKGMVVETISNLISSKLQDVDTEMMSALFDVPTLDITYLEALDKGSNKEGVEREAGYMTAYLQTMSYANQLKEIDEKLSTLTFLEPSVGSGAFVLGMIQELVRVRRNIGVLRLFTREINRTEFEEKYNPYTLKEQIIKTGVYGVDINAGAIEIAKLRIWLSLIVEMEEPIQLPNLDYHLVVGNSVIDCWNNKPLFDYSLVTEEQKQVIDPKLRKLEELKTQFFSEPHQSKEPIRQNIFSLIKEILTDYDQEYPTSPSLMYTQLYINKEGKSVQESKVLKDFTSQSDFNGLFTRFFSYDLAFSEITSNGGFDVVIGNPPYVRGTNILNKYELRKYSVYHGQADLLCYFYEKGIELLKKDGILSYITSNKWQKATYGKPLRNFLLEHKILSIIDFDDNKIFKGVATYTEITIIQKATPSPDHEIDYVDGREYVVNY